MEGTTVNEHSLEVLEQYEMVVERTARGRGTYLVWTDKGFYQLFEYNGTDTRLAFEMKLLLYISEAGFENVDMIYRTKDGELYSKDFQGTKYILKRCFSGKECDIKKNSDIVKAVDVMAKLHKLVNKIDDEELRGYEINSTSLLEQYKKHNRELKRVRTFIRNKNRRTKFEYDILGRFDEYYSYAIDAYNALEESGYVELRKRALENFSICHGAYNYHNVLMVDSGVAVVNFDHANVDMQLEDLYFFLRKVMEKHDWDVKLGSQIIDKYNEVRPIGEGEWQVFKVMLMYPEKYWKILNQYNNGRKSWIPDKNVEKLQAVYGKQHLKMEFVKRIWT